MRLASSILLLLLLTVGVQAQPVAPERGSTLRTAVLDGLRAGITDVAGLERDVLFRVHKLAVLEDYALATVTPISPVGDRIYEFEKDLPCDRKILALLKNSESGWRVAERDVGPCDYVWPMIFEQSPEYPTELLGYWEAMDAIY